MQLLGFLLLGIIVILHFWFNLALIDIFLALAGLFAKKRIAQIYRGVKRFQQKRIFSFGLFQGALFGIFLLGLFITFNDSDSDGVSFYKETKIGLNSSYEDTDRDIMKDGIELKESNNDQNLFHPQNPDVNKDEISDFCNAIIIHKSNNEPYFREVIKNNFSRSVKIDICDKVLVARDNFKSCFDDYKKDYKKNEYVVLNMRCKDLVYAKIPDLREKNYYIQY